MVEFTDITPISSSIIMVVGVGGGGSNAVNHMYRLGITDVSFMVCNTDRQALERSPIPTKIRLGENLTEGLGAGNKPERGRAAAEESIDDVKEVLRENNIKMVFITAGMGGGTGTGAAPVIAKAAKEMDILTVAIVTIPFKTEGRTRVLQAIEGIEAIRHNVDSLLVVNNENIHEIYGDLTLSEAFGKADDILATAAKSIAEIITRPNNVNVDFADVQTVMKNSGIALMGSARGTGPNRAHAVAQMAMSSPLLNHKDISGARNVLLNITSGTKEVTLTETYQITQFVQERTGNRNETDLIWGAGIDDTLGEEIEITIIATGFDIDSLPALRERYSDFFEPKPCEEAAPQRQSIPLEGSPETPAPKAAPVYDGFEIISRPKEAPRTTTPPPAPATAALTIPPATVTSPRKPADTPSQPTPSTSEETPVAGAPQDEETPDRPAFTQPTPGTPATELSEEQIENIPAYLRRNIRLDAEAPSGKVSRESLKQERNTNSTESNGNGLFD